MTKIYLRPHRPEVIIVSKKINGIWIRRGR